ncbi:flavoprotein [Actinomadura rupiterrae]|uniref:flavoprotein n=1 Tax=Actinomadura rupiterrae TaxID=559627 RepID=UPI0020A5E692|nr:flavoprotein [Actinomadura rupiterrae]MCP2336105.1 phosphopantothenoylcysteine synthetase/decarboxylase [Actinomadura rupiterrae]
MSDQQRVLYLMCFGSSGSRYAHEGVRAAQDAGWTVCVMTTPKGREFVDVPRIEEMTGYPVRSVYKQPDEPDAFPVAGAFLAAPITVTSINKWAAGIGDTVPLGYLIEGYGLNVPTVAMPYSSHAHMAHPVLNRSLEALESFGVTVLLGDGTQDAKGRPHFPPPEKFPWQAGLDALEHLTRT